MARTNTTARSAPVFTHEGAPAARHLTSEQQLRRSAMSCMLWESEFYEDGQEIGQRIFSLASLVDPSILAAIAVEARNIHHLRHVPLLLLCGLAAHKGAKSAQLVRDTVAATLRRADEPAELLSMLWRGIKPDASGKLVGRKLPHQVAKGIADALQRFDEYQLAKYRGEDDKIKLRDVFRLVRPTPKDAEQAALWGRVVRRELATPDTWEVELSGGKAKKDVFERLLAERRLGYFALLRNLRNMAQASVDESLVRAALLERRGAHSILPFRYVAAARACPQWEPWIDQALLACVGEQQPLVGKTVVLVDVSGSMDQRLSAKSDLRRIDAASTLASVINGDLRIFAFSDGMTEVPPRRGMAGVAAIIGSLPHGGTNLFAAVQALNEGWQHQKAVSYDRLIVITDEQAHGGYGTGYHNKGMPAPRQGARGYMINVASAKNGVGYGPWTHIDGFSEGVLRYIHALEAAR